MKSNADKKIHQIILGILILIVSISAQNSGYVQKSNVINLNVAGGYSESFIYIDGGNPNNWTWTVGNYSWCYIENAKVTNFKYI